MPIGAPKAGGKNGGKWREDEDGENGGRVLDRQ